MKKVLVVGGGGREHALVWKLSASPHVAKVFCAPGNAGIARYAECIPIRADNNTALADFAEKELIDLTVVGPEAPLTTGIVDLFRKRGLAICGPDSRAAALEGSKAFAKEFMKKYHIPTAEYRIFSSPEEAKAYVLTRKTPLVIKADGLAAGKGVIIAMTGPQALEAIELIMVRKEFGDAGNQVVIEALLQGEEASFMVFTDGDAIVPMSSAQDHKAIFDGDQGPNTGGMGAYSPAPIVSSSVYEKIMQKIMIPTIQGMAAEGRKYEGILYAGVMITDGEPWVLEYNARLGDPETQPVLMKLKTDLFSVLEGIAAHTLEGVQLQWDEGDAVCVVMASSGYPGAYSTGRVISGLAGVEKMDGVQVFHAGTAWENGQYVTSGGRVLGVTALGRSIEESIALAYEGVSKISWDGVYYRRDIGSKALKRDRPA